MASQTTSGQISSSITEETLNKTLPPVPTSDEENTPPTQNSPNALRELDILLRDSTTPEGQQVQFF